MAHLEVRPKPSRPWWVWALAIIILLALAAMVFKQCNHNPGEHPSIAGPGKDTITENKAIAATNPDWEKIDFNASKSTDTMLKATDIYTQTNGSYRIYGLGQNVLFKIKSAEFSENGISKLKQISQMLNSRFPKATIGVFGNTDSTETADDKKLGLLRAEAVKEWLSSNGDIEEQQISVRSLGDSQPVASNQTKEGRQQNRNVAIVVFPKSTK